MINLTNLATKTRQMIKRQKTFFNRIVLKIKAALTPIVKINANFPQQKPLVTNTHTPLKEQLVQELSYKKSVQTLFSNFYFVSEQQIISYKRPL